MKIALILGAVFALAGDAFGASCIVSAQMSGTPYQLLFTSKNGSTPASQTFTLLSSGVDTGCPTDGVTVSVSVSTDTGGNWLSVSPASTAAPLGSAGPPVTVSVDPSGLGSGQYTGTLTFSSRTPGVAAGGLAVTVGLTVNTLTITTGSLPGGIINVPYSSTTLHAAGGTPPIYGWLATGLPSGLSLSPGTGVLNGTPTQSGTFPVTVSVKDSSLPMLTAAHNYSVTIAAALTVATISLPGGVINVPYPSTPVQANGGTPPYNSWQAVGLPAGLTLDPATGVLSGASTRSGTFPVTISVKDSSSPVLTASRIEALTIVPALTVTTASLLSGVINVPYPSATLHAGGGTPPYNNWQAVGLPPGLTLDPDTGVLSGAPIQAGTFPVTISVWDSSSSPLTASRVVSLTIGGTFTVTTTSLPGGIVKVTYPSTPLQAVGGTPPYNHWLATGLPAGLTLNSTTGVLSGTPTQSATFPMTISVNDSSSPPLTAAQSVSITIAAAFAITTTSLPSWVINAPYPSTTLQAVGGTPPYNSWKAAGLPAGLSLDPDTGVLSGTPTQTAIFRVTFTVKDSSSPVLTVSQADWLTIVPALTITTSSLPSRLVNTVYPSTTLKANGGTPPYNSWLATGLPAGLNLDPATGALTGTPAESGTFPVTISVSDSSTPALTTTQPYSLTILASLTITTASLPGGMINAPYPSTTMQASGGTPPYGHWLAAGLPAGLSLNTNTGVLSGTPTQSGTFPVAFSVKDSSSPVVTTALTDSLTISAGLTITTTALPGGMINAPYPSTTLQASGGTPPYAGWSATGLPSGLALDPSTGVLSGTPTQSGTFPVTVTVNDAASPAMTASRIASLTIGTALAITTASLPSGTINVRYPSTTLKASGGTPPYTGWLATGLPPGLSLDPATGVLTGTPTQAATFPLTVSVNDSASPPMTAAQTYSLAIVGVFAITATPLPDGTINVPYPSITLEASGGTPPYNHWVATGLPPGLSLNSTTGVLSGTPTKSGTFPLGIIVKDSSSPALTALQAASMTIVAPFTITTTSLPGGTVNVPYPSTTLKASGGAPPYNSWLATGLPPGLGVDPATGVLSGTPTQSATFPMTISVKDSSSPALTAAQSVSFTIAAGFAITTISLPAGTVNVLYPSTTLQAGGGTPPYNSWLATGLPAGLALNAATGVLSGTPTKSGTFPVAVTASDSAKHSSAKQLTLTVSPATAPPTAVNATITQSTSTSLPNQAALSIVFEKATQSNLSGTLALSFQPNPRVSGVASGYVDPSAGFPISGQSGTALTTNLTIPQGTAQSPVQLALGTVAGTWTIKLAALTSGAASVLPSPAPSATIVVEPAAPVIVAGSVHITGLTASGFVVHLDGYSSTRAVTGASFQFNAAAGTTLQNNSPIPVSFNGTDQSQWFATPQSQPYGGAFSLQVPFSFSGSTGSLGSVAVTLTNADGTSISVTGTP